MIKLDFSSKDHHINIVEVKTSLTSFDGKRVNFRVECEYADKNFDDPYKGEVDVLIMADVE